MTWKDASDLKDPETKSYYQWPPRDYVASDTVVNYYPGVTTILGMASNGFYEASMWFIAAGVAQIAQDAKERKPYSLWSKARGQMVDVRGIDLLSNNLNKDDFPGQYGGLFEIKALGHKEMTRRANRGTVVHRAIEDFVQGVRIFDEDIHDYTKELLQTFGFMLPVEFCEPYVRSVLAWCHENIEEVYMTEAPVFSDEFNYAGTVDLCAKLKGHDGVWMTDAKTSKDAQLSHGMQLAAYANAEWVGIRGTFDTVPMERPDRIANLYVQPEGCTLREWGVPKKSGEQFATVDDLFQAFLHLRAAWQVMEAGALPVTVKPPKVAPVTGDKIKVARPKRAKEMVTA